MFSGKTVLVTGAGGSIGSAICERIAQTGAKLLVMYELNEYALYRIDQKLKCKRLAVLGDVKDEKRLLLMPTPDIVFHAAAYKHVPMLEGINADEGYKNNVQGTYAVMSAFQSAERIILLSTDKAINPVSVMGRSKLVCENVARSHNRTVGRLGNILESSGSVIPKFREQIEAGGPVTVTDPRVTRYFLSMDTAVDFLTGLALKAPGVYQAEMGEPQSILEIARKMIGDRDIPIEFIGLRPGEKLHEELEERAFA